MKRNVDLTEYSDFRSRSEDPRELMRGIRLGSGGFFPWYSRNMTRVESMSDTEQPDDVWGVIQGNALERRAKMFYDEWGRGRKCDCCGHDLYPYYSDLFLCQVCNDRMSQEGVVDFDTWR